MFLILITKLKTQYSRNPPFGYKKRLGSYNPAEQAALAQNQTFRSVVRSVYCSAIK